MVKSSSSDPEELTVGGSLGRRADNTSNMPWDISQKPKQAFTRSWESKEIFIDVASSRESSNCRASNQSRK